MDARIALLAEPGWSQPARAQALGLLQQAASEQAERVQAAHDYQGMSVVAHPSLRYCPHCRLQVRALEENAASCLARDDFACLERLLPELAARGAHEAEARARGFAADRLRQQLDAALAAAQGSWPREVLNWLETAAGLAKAMEAFGSPASTEVLNGLTSAQVSAQAEASDQLCLLSDV